MRVEWMSLVLLMAAGCSAGPVDFEHRSSLETRTRGVALLEDSPTAQVGMGGNTCEVQTDSAMIGADYDVAVGEDDNVQDAVGQGTIIVGDSGVYVLTPGFGGTGWDQAAVDTSGIVEARFDDAGIVTLEGGGSTVGWYDDSGLNIGRVSAPADAGAGSGFTVDRTTGTAFIGTASGVVIATPTGGVSTVEGGAGLVAWDAAAAALYVADPMGMQVRALEADGTERWSVDMGGAVWSLDDMAGMAAVMVEISDGGTTHGELRVLDGQTGSIVSTLETPSAAEEVVVGNDGRTMAMVLPGEVHFFAVDLSAE